MDDLVKKYVDDAKTFLLDLINTHQHLGYDQTRRLPMTRLPLLDQATVLVNCNLGSHFYVTFAGNRTLDNPANARDGQILTFEIIQDATGSRTLTLGSKFNAGALTMTLTTTANKRDIIECFYSANDDKFYITKFVKGY